MRCQQRQKGNTVKYLTTLSYLIKAVLLLSSSASFALSPPNPAADIGWDVDSTVPGDQSSAPGITAGSVEAIEAAFSNARREEEQQYSITPDAMGTLNLPSQTLWDTMTMSERALMIINAERQARNGVNYPGHGVVAGLPLEAVESHLNKMAEDYAEYMASNNFWAHNVPAGITAPPFAGTGSFNRIWDHPVIGAGAGTAGANCYQFLSFAENLHVSASSVANGPVPQTLIEGAIYGWLYDDAGSSWGHRVAMMLQDQTLQGGAGFNNDHGSASSEGFMGIGFAGRGDGSFAVFNGTSFPTQWTVVWLVMDPANDPACNYGIPSRRTLPDNSWQTISLPAIPPEGANTVADIFGDDIAAETYDEQWKVWMWDETAGASGGYVDPGINGVLEPGRAFWIIQATGATVTLDMPVGSKRTPMVSSEACSVPMLQGCWAQPLTARGAFQWNLLANPFYTRPSIDALRVQTTAGTCSDSDGCSMTEAADREVADTQVNDFWAYRNSAYTRYSDGDQMQPWDGVWNVVLPGANGASPVLRIPRN